MPLLVSSRERPVQKRSPKCLSPSKVGRAHIDQNQAIASMQPTMQIDAEKEKKIILRLYRRLLRKAKPFLSGDDAKQIKKAFLFAQEAHKEMRRKSGEPYIYHPIEVALIAVEEIGLGTTSIISALLHDVVEDTGFEISDIEERFGKKVARIVDGLTKVSTKATEGKSIQAENFQRLLVTISEDTRVVLIKIADRLHNMRTLDSLPERKKLKIKSETEYIYAPLAHRLGLYSIKSELEDLALKHSDEEAYNDIRSKIEETRATRNRFARRFIRPIETELKKQGFQFEIKTRVKSIFSIYKKMRKQGINFEQVFDLYAIRIILETPFEREKADCWKVFSTVTDFYTPNTNRLRDWISTPKSNGYESLHVTVMSHTGQWVEVQIRTRRMDDIAEKGYAAHWKYKHNNSKPEPRNLKQQELGIEQWLREVREMLENNKNSSGIEFVNDFKTNLFVKEVYAFTPRGEMRTFPKGATVLDFAFDIHSEVGARCMAAKINGRLVPFNYQLRNGDQVEILTSNKNKVNEGWLKFVQTSKATTKIKEYLKEDKKKHVAQGREIIKRKLKHIKVPFTDENTRKVAEHFGLPNDGELFYQVGKGLINHTEIKAFKETWEADKNGNKTGYKRPQKLNGNEHGESEATADKPKQSDNEIVVGDTSSMEYMMASCCMPIPGDEIFGFVTSQGIVKVHRKNCPNAVSLMANYGYRIIRARWAQEKEAEKEFQVAINIEGVDRVGLVNDVTRIISNQMQVNINSISINSKHHIFDGYIELSVHNKHEFEDLLSKIEKIDGIVQVRRVEEHV